MRAIAIIPARSGSKGLKDKNIKELNGKPMMAYTIEAANNSGIFDCVHVSTDSEKYVDIARKYGADVPFLRSDELSGDNASSWDVVRYVLYMYSNLGVEYDLFALLQPTSPLRTAEDIKNAYNIYMEKNAKAIVSVCETDHPPIFSDVIAEDGSMKGFVKKEYRDLPRQAIPKYYRVNGGIYLVNKSCLDDIVSLYDNECYAYIMDRESSIDIDSNIDFLVAETLMKNKH